ncbi:MAG: dTMP kinase [Bacteriovoracaceae bacterium]
MSSSFLISFEGIEGSGKSTQILKFKEYLERENFTPYIFREPGGCTFSEILRGAILNSKVPIHPLSEAYLFASARSQLLFEKILPILNDNPKSVVLLDRYIDSSLVYQGIARNLGVDTILGIHSHYPLNTFPALTFYLKIDPATSLERQKARGGKADYFEKESLDFHQKIADGFSNLAKRFPERIKTIEAKKSAEEVHNQIIHIWSQFKS